MKTKSTLMNLMLAIMSSCQFTHYCPGYDMEDRKIITFRKNDTIRYYSDNLATKDSLVFCVKDFYNKGGYEFSSNYPDADCYYDVYYHTNEIDGVSVQEHLLGFNTMEVQIGDDVYSFSLGYFATQNHTETKEFDYSIVYSYVLIDDNKEFCWTLNDLSGNRRFDSFTKMENRGIVKFHDKQTNQLWMLDM